MSLCEGAGRAEGASKILPSQPIQFARLAVDRRGDGLVDAGADRSEQPAKRISRVIPTAREALIWLKAGGGFMVLNFSDDFARQKYVTAGADRRL